MWPQIREAVARGRLQPEERLPSVRDLSRQLVINPNTVARVYTELERDGVLNTRPGLGVFVAQPRNDLTKRARKDRLTALVDGLLTEAVHLGFSAEEVLALRFRADGEVSVPASRSGANEHARRHRPPAD